MRTTYINRARGRLANGKCKSRGAELMATPLHTAAEAHSLRDFVEALNSVSCPHLLGAKQPAAYGKSKLYDGIVALRL